MRRKIYNIIEENKLLGVGIILLLIGVGAQLASNPQSVLFKYVNDDMFYYHVLSENTLSGHGVVFNRDVPTNGFHPLYFLITLIINFVSDLSGVLNPLYATLWLHLILHIFIGVIIYSIGEDITNKKAGITMSLIWLLNPAVFGQALSGMEPIVQVFFLSLLTLYYIKTDLTEVSPRNGAILGILVGLVFLSRMDGVFIGLGLAVALVIKRYQDSSIQNKDIIQKGHIYGGLISLFISLPWFVFSYLSVGRIFPISGDAIRLIVLSGGGKYGLPAYIFIPLDTTKQIFAKVLHYITFGYSPANLNITGTLGLGFGQFDRIVIYGLIIIVSTILLSYLIYKMYSDQSHKLFYKIDFLLISMFMILSYYIFYQYKFRDYYSLSLYFVLTLLIGIFIWRFVYAAENVSDHLKRRVSTFVHVCLITVFILSQIIGGFGAAGVSGLHQEAVYINEEVPSNTTVGNFNTGYAQYYTPNHDVINLDGVINTDAYRAMNKGRLDCYIISKNIKYIVGIKGVPAHFLGPSSPFSQGAVTYEKVGNITQGTYVVKIDVVDKQSCS